MITPILEKAILSGKATLHNYSIGGAGVCKIEIPDNHSGYLVGFTYYPYQKRIIAVNTEGDFLTDFDAFKFQEVDFYSGNLSKKWVFKVDWTSSPADAGLHLFTVIQSEYKVDCLQEFVQDIFVEFKNPQVGVFSAIDFGTLVTNQDPGTQNAVLGEGYGTTFQTVKKYTYSSGRFYYPAGLTEGGAPNGLSAYTTIQGCNNLLNTEDMYLQNASPVNNSQCPMVNAQIVLVNKVYQDKLF